MADEPFSEPDDPSTEWVDVRMTNHEEGEWDIDFVVVEGQVEYVDLRIRPSLLTAFVECLVEDVGTQRAGEVLTDVAESAEVPLERSPTEE